jgi:hypothetical protein
MEDLSTNWRFSFLNADAAPEVCLWHLSDMAGLGGDVCFVRGGMSQIAARSARVKIDLDGGITCWQ